MDYSLITDEPLNYCVYAHVNKQNGKMYIGITNNTKKRWECNGKNYKNCVHFWSAINKYGWDNFNHIILIDNVSFSIACEMEIYLIKKFNTINEGYNIMAGGTGGRTRTNPVYQYDLKGNYIRSWENPSLAEKYYGITQCAIHETSSSKSICGYQWSFEYLEKMQPYETINKRYVTPIYQYDIDGNFIKKWDYLNDAIKEYGLYTKLNADGTNKTAYGFRWSYSYKEKLEQLPVIEPKPRKKKPKELLNTLGNTPKVYRFDLSGQLIKIYDNCRSVLYDLNDANPKTIYKLCNKWDQFVYFDSVWVYEEDINNGYVELIIDRHKKLHPKIIQYDLDGNFIKEYETMDDVKRAGYSRSSVSNVCNGKGKTSSGYQWRYDYDDKPSKIKKPRGEIIPIIQKTLDGEFVAQYDNAVQAILAVTGKRKCASNILAVCKGKQKKAYGYLWEFSNQEVN